MKTLLKKITTTVVVTALAVSAFAGCSQDTGKNDMDDLDDAIEAFAKDDKADMDDFEEIYDMIIEIAEDASDDEKEDLSERLNDLLEATVGKYLEKELNKSDMERAMDLVSSKNLVEFLGKAAVDVVITQLENYIEKSEAANEASKIKEAEVNASIDED